MFKCYVSMKGNKLGVFFNVLILYKIVFVNNWNYYWGLNLI